MPPIYSFECSFCMCNFDEFHKINENSGKTSCQRCGNIAFKVPSIFNAKVFKQRQFADGTKTPEFVNTPKQEEAWMKSQKITYDAPTGREKRHIQEERKIKSEIALDNAFKDAVNKVEQGYVNPKSKERNIKNMKFNVKGGE